MKGAREIPLYRATYKLLMGVDKIQGGMTKDRKHTIGRRMMDIVLDMINYLRFAVDMPEGRKRYLLLYLGKYDQVATLLKMSEEKHDDSLLFTQRYNSYNGFMLGMNTYAIRWNAFKAIPDAMRGKVYMTGKMHHLKIR